MELRLEASFHEKILLALTSRSAVVIINLMIIALNALTLHKMLPMLFDSVNNITELEDISEAVGVILIGYGVAVEERNSFMGIFGLYPKFRNRLEDKVDHICHEYGLIYLLLGLFMEICVACIKIPNTIIDTQRSEHLIFGVSTMFMIWATALMIRHCWFVYRAEK